MRWKRVYQGGTAALSICEHGTDSGLPSSNISDLVLPSTDIPKPAILCKKIVQAAGGADGILVAAESYKLTVPDPNESPDSVPQP